MPYLAAKNELKNIGSAKIALEKHLENKKEKRKPGKTKKHSEYVCTGERKIITTGKNIYINS